MPRPMVDESSMRRSIGHRAAPGVLQRFGAIGDEPAGGTPEEFAADRRLQRGRARRCKTGAKDGARRP